MNTFAGLWLDHKDAVMATFSGNKTIVNRLHSKLRRRSKSTGGARKAPPYTFDGGGAYKKIEHKRDNLIRKYYDAISKELAGVQKFFVMGPGEAKTEFAHFLLKKNDLKNKLAGVATVDRMSDRQIAAKTKEFFKKELRA